MARRADAVSARSYRRRSISLRAALRQKAGASGATGARRPVDGPQKPSLERHIDPFDDQIVVDQRPGPETKIDVRIDFWLCIGKSGCYTPRRQRRRVPR